MHGWQVTPLAVVTGLGTSRGPRLCLSGFLMHTSNRSGFRHWPRSASETNRTAVYGPVCTVVWQGSAGNRCPYADQRPFRAPSVRYFTVLPFFKGTPLVTLAKFYLMEWTQPRFSKGLMIGPGRYHLTICKK